MPCPNIKPMASGLADASHVVESITTLTCKLCDHMRCLENAWNVYHDALENGSDVGNGNGSGDMSAWLAGSSDTAR